MLKRNPEAERQYWLQLKKQGKGAFLRREILGNLVIWLVVVTTIGVLGANHHSSMSNSSIHNTAISALITLPIFLLGGYLLGNWRWKQFEKKHPES